MKKNIAAMILLLTLMLVVLALSQVKEETIERAEPVEVEVIATIRQPLETKYVPIIPKETEAEQTIDEMIVEIAGAYNICPELIYSVIEAESQFDTEAVNSCGAIGLMQVVPKWHELRMERLGVTDLTDPYQNILVGTDILAELFAKYGDDVYLVLMCYNEGQYGTAIQRAEAGEYSYYAKKIVERSQQLERIHEQEDK